MSAGLLLKNFAAANVVTVPSPAASGTSLDVQSGRGARFVGSTSSPQSAVLYDSTTYADPADDPNAEIVTVTGIATDTLTIVRAQEGTTAIATFVGGKTYRLVQGLTAGAMSNVPRMLKSSTGAPAATSTATTDTVVATYNVPAGLLAPGDLLRITTLWQHAGGTAIGWNFGVKVGTTTLTAGTGATNTAIRQDTELGVQSASASRYFDVRQIVGAGTTTFASGNNTDTVASGLTIEWHAWMSGAPGAESVRLEYYSVEILKGA